MGRAQAPAGTARVQREQPAAWGRPGLLGEQEGAVERPGQVGCSQRRCEQCGQGARRGRLRPELPQRKGWVASEAGGRGGGQKEDLPTSLPCGHPEFGPP